MESLDSNDDEVDVEAVDEYIREECLGEFYPGPDALSWNRRLVDNYGDDKLVYDVTVADNEGILLEGELGVTVTGAWNGDDRPALLDTTALEASVDVDLDSWLSGKGGCARSSKQLGLVEGRHSAPAEWTSDLDRTLGTALADDGRRLLREAFRARVDELERVVRDGFLHSALPGWVVSPVTPSDLRVSLNSDGSWSMGSAALDLEFPFVASVRVIGMGRGDTVRARLGARRFDETGERWWQSSQSRNPMWEFRTEPSGVAEAGDEIRQALNEDVVDRMRDTGWFGRDG